MKKQISKKRLNKNHSKKIKRGILKAKQKGIIVGRPKNEVLKKEDEIMSLIQDGLSYRKIAKELNVSLSTVSKVSKRNKYENKSLIKSKERVAEVGEVFTPPKIVKNMCDLIKDDILDIETEMMEPTCGTGNFLVEIIDRRMRFIGKEAKTQDDFEKKSFIAFFTITAIDIMKDNIKTSKERSLKVFSHYYKKKYKQNCDPSMYQIIKYILDLKYQQGNSLTFLRTDGSNLPLLCYNFVINDNNSLYIEEYTFKNFVDWKASDKEYELIPNKKKIYPHWKMITLVEKHTEKKTIRLENGSLLELPPFMVLPKKPDCLK